MQTPKTFQHVFAPVGYCVALIDTLVLVGLDNIQEDLENPYDGIGVDDIEFGGGSTESQTQVNFCSLALELELEPSPESERLR